MKLNNSFGNAKEISSMFYQDPRMVYGNAIQFTTAPTLPYGAQTLHSAQGYDLTVIAQRLEQMNAQIAYLNNVVATTVGAGQTGVGYGMHHAGLHGAHVGTGYTHGAQAPFFGQTVPQYTNGLRLRESDSTIFWDLFLPNLGIGDVEVEVIGNRITCRTKVPASQFVQTWKMGTLPRGIECFELADGRVEFCWVSGVSFVAKDVEATFREGYLCICIPKTEVAAKHTVKVVRDTTVAGQRRAANDMNS